MSPRVESVVLVGAGALIVVLIAVNVMAAQGRFESEGESPEAAAPATTDTGPAEEPTREPTGSEPEEQPATTEAETQTETETAETVTATETERPSPPRLVLTAARGECYLVVRRGDEEGEVLYEAILPQNGAVDFSAPRLWLRIGASRNLDATLDGKPIELPDGTVDVVVTRAGARLA